MEPSRALFPVPRTVIRNVKLSPGSSVTVPRLWLTTWSKMPPLDVAVTSHVSPSGGCCARTLIVGATASGGGAGGGGPSGAV